MLLDILAASLFSWQEQHDGKFLTIAVDELKDQNLAPNSPLRSIITDGRKFHTALLGATQDYFDQRHPQLDAMRQANIRSFCRPGKSEERIAETLGFKDATDAGFNTFRSGDVIIAFDAYNKETGANEPTVLRGKVVDFVDTPLYDRFKQEYQGADPQMNTTESSDLSEASQPEDAETEIEEILLEMMESEPSTVEAQLSQPQEMGDSVPEAVDEVPEAESLETLNPEIAEPPKSVPTGVELAEFISETEETLPEVSMPLNSLSTEMKGSELSTVEAQQSQPPETVNDAPELFVDVPETEYSETVEQLAQPQSEPDEPKEDPQILIEQELQKQFRNRINHYSPDYPNGEVYLSELFAQIMEKHHFSSQVDRETMQKRLNRFMRISLDRFDYISLMEILFNEIWPKN